MPLPTGTPQYSIIKHLTDKSKDALHLILSDNGLPQEGATKRFLIYPTPEECSQVIQISKTYSNSVCAWFNDTVFEEFKVFQETLQSPVANCEVTGQCGFGVGLPKSPLQCAVISNNISAFWDFCAFMQERFKAHSEVKYTATNTASGLPLLTIEFPESVEKYDGHLNPEIEHGKTIHITFRTDDQNELIQQAGEGLFEMLDCNPETSSEVSFGQENCLSAVIINLHFLSSNIAQLLQKQERMPLSDIQKEVLSELQLLRHDLCRSFFVLAKDTALDTPVNQELLTKHTEQIRERLLGMHPAYTPAASGGAAAGAAGESTPALSYSKPTV